MLDSVSRPLLARLAERLRRTQHALLSDDLAPAFYEAATRDDCDSGLRQALDGIAALASNYGAGVLLGTGTDRGVDLAREYGTCSFADRAVLAFLEHPDVFCDARAQVRAVNRRLYAVFPCTRDVPFAPDPIKAQLPWLERQISAWLRKHGRPEACRAIVTETGPHVVVDIVVQCAPSLCVTQGGAEILASNKRQDTLVFDRSGCCVSIHASSQCEIEFYRGLAGQLVCEDSNAFRANHVFQLRRLLCPAEWECKRHPVAGLSRVVLRSIEVEAGSRRTRWRGDADLSTGRDVVEVLEGAEQCTRVELELHAEHRPYPYAVEIVPPNRICLDQRAIGNLAAAYLKARGLFVAA